MRAWSARYVYSNKKTFTVETQTRTCDITAELCERKMIKVTVRACGVPLRFCYMREVFTYRQCEPFLVVVLRLSEKLFCSLSVTSVQNQKSRCGATDV